MSKVPTLPDRRAMEGFMSAIGGRQANDATAKAQQVMYEAWDQTSPSTRVALAHKALAISPLCADAYVLLAEQEAQSAEEALELYRKGVKAGEQALGPKGFKEYTGHFRASWKPDPTCAHERDWPLLSTYSARFTPRSVTIRTC